MKIGLKILSDNQAIVNLYEYAIFSDNISILENILNNEDFFDVNCAVITFLAKIITIKEFREDEIREISDHFVTVARSNFTSLKDASKNEMLNEMITTVNDSVFDEVSSMYMITEMISRNYDGKDEYSIYANELISFAESYDSILASELLFYLVNCDSDTMDDYDKFLYTQLLKNFDVLYESFISNNNISSIIPEESSNKIERVRKLLRKSN